MVPKKLCIILFIVAGISTAAYCIEAPQNLRVLNLVSTPSWMKYFGVIGVPVDKFAEVDDLGGNAVSFSWPAGAAELKNGLAQAKALNLNFGARFHGQANWSTAGKKVDYSELASAVNQSFGGETFQSDTAFSYLYLVDEPCDNDYLDLTRAEYADLYKFLKQEAPGVPVLINFSALECMQQYIPVDVAECSNSTVTDIAAFVITETKLNRNPDFIESQFQISQTLKQCYPDLKIFVFIAAYEFTRMGLPMPSAAWLKETGLAALDYDFDGVYYFSWEPNPSYMGDTIGDVIHQPEYFDAVQAVFEKASAQD